MVRSANLFCFRQKPWRTNSKVWVWTSYKDTIVVFVTLYADGWPPCTLSNYAGSADSRRIFSRTGNRVYGRTHFPGMKINFWLERGARTHNLFNLVLLRLRRPLVSTAAAARSLLPWCSPLSSTTSLWAVVVADVLVVLAILLSNLGVVCCFEILHQQQKSFFGDESLVFSFTLMITNNSFANMLKTRTSRHWERILMMTMTMSSVLIPCCAKQPLLPGALSKQPKDSTAFFVPTTF